MATTADSAASQGQDPSGAPVSSPSERIVQAARRVFFDQGFKHVTTDVLARQAGVSKATLYKYFPSMEAVLQAVVEAEVETFSVTFPLDATTTAQFRDTLVRFGEGLLVFLNRPETIAFAQLMAEEARIRPEMARTFYQAAYARTQDDLSRILQHGLEQGHLAPRFAPAEVAEQLLGMWEGFGFVRAQLGLTDRPFPQPRAWSERCVQALLGTPELP